ncbi:hypothetical protein HanIR_Chr10g0450981 [Helianthus annuus]|nr:hypothetical protein HanIR_Chr10g0450981 [Helianthus annuus]
MFMSSRRPKYLPTLSGPKEIKMKPAPQKMFSFFFCAEQLLLVGVCMGRFLLLSITITASSVMEFW